MTKKLFVIFIKYIPLVQMIGNIINNLLYIIITDNAIVKFNDFILGNSFLVTILLYICSCTFNFCCWHRLLITANFINILIAWLDYTFHFNINNITLIIVYLIVDFIIILLCLMHKNKRYEY